MGLQEPQRPAPLAARAGDPRCGWNPALRCGAVPRTPEAPSPGPPLAI